MNKIGKSRCEEGNDVSQAQRSGPLLLVFYKLLNPLRTFLLVRTARAPSLLLVGGCAGLSCAPLLGGRRREIGARASTKREERGSFLPLLQSPKKERGEEESNRCKSAKCKEFANWPQVHKK